MVRIFKHRTKNIILLHFQFELNGNDKELLNRIYEKYLKNIEPYHHITIIDKNAAVTDKIFVSDMSDLTKKFGANRLSLNFVGLSGLKKFFFRMYSTLTKVDKPTYLFDVLMEIENKYDISCKNDFRDEFEELS